MTIIELTPSGLFWFVAGLLASIIVSTTTRLFIDFYYRPRLLIENPRLVQRGGNERLRIRVKNEGRTVANKCSALIEINGFEQEQILATTSGGISDPDLTSPLEECIEISPPWDNNSPIRDINRSDFGMLEICQKVDNGIAFASEDGSSDPAVILTHDASYSVTIRVTSAQADAAKETVTIQSTPSQLGVNFEIG